MPDHELKQLLTYIVQNKGILSETKKKKFFEALSEELRSKLEVIVQESFQFK